MKNGWKHEKLRDLCEFRNGLWKGKKGPFETVRVIRNTNFTKDGKLDRTDIIILEAEATQFSKRKLEFGDIILEKSGGGPKQPVGRVVVFDIVGGNYSFSNFTSVVRVIDKTRLDFGFLHRYLDYCYRFGMTEPMQSHTTGIRNLTFDLYKDIDVPVPPIEEQRRIVAILDEAFACIDKAKANTEKNIQNARELFDSYLNNIFSNPGPDWEEKGFEEFCEISSVLVDPRLSEFQDLTHVGAANIETKTGELSDLKTAREEKLISGKFWFDESMVLYSKIRPYLMKVARPEFDGLCSADIYPLGSKNGAVNRDFLFYLLLSPNFTDYAISGSARAGMPKVNREHLFAYRCHLPPIKLQKEIAKKFDEISFESRAMESTLNQKLAYLDELNKSILHRAFRGEVG